jgi:hypothetical protein
MRRKQKSKKNTKKRNVKTSNLGRLAQRRIVFKQGKTFSVPSNVAENVGVTTVDATNGALTAEKKAIAAESSTTSVLGSQNKSVFGPQSSLALSGGVVDRESGLLCGKRPWRGPNCIVLAVEEMINQKKKPTQNKCAHNTTNTTQQQCTLTYPQNVIG